MKRIWEIYPALCRAVKASHDALPWPMLHCHDFDHVLRVGDRAVEIAITARSGQLAGAAGLCHNADRILQKLKNLDRNGQVPENEIRRMVADWLDAEPEMTFSIEERDRIVSAVLHHGGPNARNYDLVLTTLQDADRTVNIEVDVIIRKGQYFGDDLPVVDPVHLLSDPDATFRDPRSILWTMMDEEKCFLATSGPAFLRLPKARELAKMRFAFYRAFLAELIAQREEAGLIPYPNLD